MNVKRLNMFFLGLLTIAGLIVPCSVEASPRPGHLAEAIFHADEIVLDGTVEVTDKGTLLFTSDDEYVVVLEGVADVARPGQHIMVVGYPYKKDGSYYLNVTSYTYLFKDGHSIIE